MYAKGSSEVCCCWLLDLTDAFDSSAALPNCVGIKGCGLNEESRVFEIEGYGTTLGYAGK